MPRIEILSERHLGELEDICAALLATEAVIGLTHNVEFVVDVLNELLDANVAIGVQVDFFAVVFVDDVYVDASFGVKPLDRVPS